MFDAPPRFAARGGKVQTMARRSKHGSDRFEKNDSPIGLTGAFEPVSVDEGERYDSPVGLTQAFGPLPDEDAPNWDSSSKWEGFDWNAPVEGAEGAGDEEADSAESPAAGDGAAGDDASQEGGRGRHARHAASKAEAAADADAAAGKPGLSARMERSRRTRKRLVGIIVLLLIIFVALGLTGYRLLTGHYPFFEQPQSEQQEETTSPDIAEQVVAPSGQDAQEVAVRTVDIPELVSLFGKTQDEAIDLLQRGAFVTSSATIDDKGSVIKKTMTVELADEPGNPRGGGSPKVYLGVDKDGNVVQVGYSAPAGSLGYGTLNFQDAVAEEHIIEKTLQAIGAAVEEGTVALPADAKEYTTYASDGTTVAKERYSFGGDVDVADIPCSWSAVLSYDYTSANISGNASETVRLIYVYLTEKIELPPEEEPAEGEQAEGEQAENPEGGEGEQYEEYAEYEEYGEYGEY